MNDSEIATIVSNRLWIITNAIRFPKTADKISKLTQAELLALLDDRSFCAQLTTAERQIISEWRH